MIAKPFKKGWREGTLDDLGNDGYEFIREYIEKINWWHNNDRVAILKSTKDEKAYILKLFSDDNEYRIYITPTYIGGSSSCRKREPLEDWHRGDDLPDGKCIASTMEKIIYAILHNELIPYDDGCKQYQADEDQEQNKTVK